MYQSLYQEYVDKWFAPMLIALMKTVNGKKEEQPYLFTQYLTKVYSVDGKWESILSKYNKVIADVVAMDSALPLKIRDSISKAKGDIPKIGMELKLKETELTKIDNLLRMGKISEATKLIFDDSKRCFDGIYERMESLFYQALSTGLIEVDTENVGISVRLDYSFLDENKFGVAVDWTSVNSATPIDDIQKVMDKVRVDRNTVQTLWINRTDWDKLKRTAQFKQHWAFSNNFIGTNVPTPNDDQARQTMLSEFRLNVNIVEKTFIYEIDGVRNNFDAWGSGKLVFTPSGKIGELVYADLAELNHKVEGVNYQLLDDYVLISKFHEKRPALAEITQSQCRALPVIGNVQNIYILDIEEIQELQQ